MSLTPSFHRVPHGEGCRHCACTTLVETETGLRCAACGADIRPERAESLKKQHPLLIYVAGPYSAATLPARLENVQRAVDAGLEILDLGHYPFLPHLTHFFSAYAGAEAITYQEYIAWGLTVLARCDGLLYLGSSPGADTERAYAEELGLPVYRSLEELPSPPSHPVGSTRA